MKNLLRSITLFTILLAFSSNTLQAQLTNTPDRVETEMGDLMIYPINHGTVAFTFDGKTIFVDPYGGAERFANLDAPDIIFITDIHGDHLNKETLEGLNTEKTTFVVPEAVAAELGEAYVQQTVVIGNGENIEVMGIPVRAIPMYNLPDDETSRHSKGRGNGYIINFGGMETYLSGDTEDIPEMRNLESIEIAFVCMNLPYTMDINQASSAVLDFEPMIMYPYHHRGQDIEAFKALVDAGNTEIDVRLKDWYPSN